MTEQTTEVKHCIKCESVMNLKTNNTTGAKFYSCSNWPACKFTQSAKAETPTQKPSTDEADSPEGRAAKQVILNAVEKCNATLETVCARLDIIGPRVESIAMASEIPGFGKLADELTDEERAKRADYFSNRVKGLSMVKRLPYDQNEQLAGGE